MRAEPAPPPGSPAELAAFADLQAGLVEQYRALFHRPDEPRTVVVAPSLSLHQQVLDNIAGAPFYEERLLALLMLLRMPRTKVVYLSSNPIHPTIIDYYLHLLSGIPSSHARRRLVLVPCHDDSSVPLTHKVLDRPRVIERIRAEIDDPASAHLTCFNVTDLERSLAVRLGIPVYGCDPALSHLGDKSHGREVMRAAGVRVPPGHEHLTDLDQLAEAIADLKGADPDLRRVVVKLNEGFSGEGNAMVDVSDAPRAAPAALASWVADVLPSRLEPEAPAETWASFSTQFLGMGGVVETFLEGDEKRSPNVRLRITPTGEVEIISTQDQILGGPSGQVYLACRFPADDGYRLEIQEASLAIGAELRDRGVIGQVGPDFLCRRVDGAWECFGIELNVRMGGATHPFLMLQHMTDGHYDAATATYRTHSGQQRCYVASDNVTKPSYRGLTPDDLIDIAVDNGIHFHGATQEGVVFHLVGALSRFGKFGMVCIDATPEGADRRYAETVATLDRAVGC